jgi:hypothetical protein
MSRGSGVARGSTLGRVHRSGAARADDTGLGAGIGATGIVRSRIARRHTAPDRQDPRPIAVEMVSWGDRRRHWRSPTGVLARGAENREPKCASALERDSAGCLRRVGRRARHFLSSGFRIRRPLPPPSLSAPCSSALVGSRASSALHNPSRRGFVKSVRQRRLCSRSNRPIGDAAPSGLGSAMRCAAADRATGRSCVRPVATTKTCGSGTAPPRAAAGRAVHPSRRALCRSASGRARPASVSA